MCCSPERSGTSVSGLSPLFARVYGGVVFTLTMCAKVVYMTNNTATTKRQSNRQRALALAAELGVEIEFWSGKDRSPFRGPSWSMEYDVPAPDGMVWHCTQSHFLTYSTTLEQGDPEAKPELYWKGLAEDLAAGLEPCPYRPTCECCD